jgi:hypothetical protein
MLRRVVHVTADVSEEPSASIIRVARIGELGKTLAVISNRPTANVVPGSSILVSLMMALGFSETSVVTKATRRNIPEDGILNSHRRGNLKSYIALTSWALKRRRNVSPVKYELGLYIPGDDILHSHRRENLKSYTDVLH